MIDSSTLLRFINEPQAISLNDIMLLENMTKKHPFFQLGYSLIAKGIHSKAPDIANEAIKKAATYALSRNALRKVIENDIDWTNNASIRGIEKSAVENTENMDTYPSEHLEDELIASIANNNQNSLLDAQLVIIDEFIRSKPRINQSNQSNEVEEEMEDLSVSSTRLNQPLYTESFAKILIKQSKINEAIEVYQNLMIQIPEKSTYFAAKIEEINRKYLID